MINIVVTYLFTVAMFVCAVFIAFGWVDAPTDFNKFATVGLLYIGGVVTGIWAKLREKDR